MSEIHRPMFSAVSSSVRHLTQILRCIGFSPKAHAQISDVGIRFSVQESRVMQGRSMAFPSLLILIFQGFAFLQKELFSSYMYTANSEGEHPILQVSLESLLETLQIFGLNESSNRWSTNTYGGVSHVLSRGDPSTAFDNRILGTSGICRLSYARPGAPLDITLEEKGMTTTCELTAYEPDLLPDIPFDKTAIVQKIIMRSDILLDAINELSSTSPEKITITASASGRQFSLSSDGPHGSASVEFSPDPQLLETFEVAQRVSNTYKYSLIKATNRVMAMASKVSVRVDQQGVLSLQFLIELDTGLKNFIDFRFVPYLDETEESEDDDRDGFKD